MPAAAVDYFRYFPVARETVAWGVAVSAAGFTRIPPNSPYPPARHPDDHALEWNRGRVLEALQIVLICEGSGQFESWGTKPQMIGAGDAFILFPGAWHRYRPEPASGWVESWVELRGETVARLLQKKVFLNKMPVLRNALSASLEARLNAVHVRARQPQPGFDPELASLGLAVLAAWQQAGVAPQHQSRIARAVAEAERYLSENFTGPINIAQLARRLGVVYSHFRNAFKKYTGYSPWQYVLHLRLVQARRMLSAPDATLEEVACSIGFSSPFHLSVAFKRAYGVAPAHWRRKFFKEAKSSMGDVRIR